MIHRFSNITLSMAAMLVLTACSASFSIGQPSPQDQQAAKTQADPAVAGDFDTHIHDYLMAHPEVISEAQRFGMQKQAEARQAQAKVAIGANRSAIFNSPADPVIGNQKGDVAIVVFQDAECPFCKKLAPDLDALIQADPGVKVVLKEFPILGPMSETAAKYALAARSQGKYAEFHRALMASTIQEHQLTEENVLDFAAKSGLDIARLKADAAAPGIMAQVIETRALAQKIGVNGTPGVIIGDTLQPGTPSLDVLKKAVADARARKVAMVQ